MFHCFGDFMYYLVYVSSATSLLPQSELLSILEKSRCNNENFGITGMLLYSNGTIIQALEGNEAAVKNLYKKISLDSRHKDVIVIVEGEHNEREFGNWSMAFYNLSEIDTKSIVGFSDFLENPSAREVWSEPTVCQRLLIAFRNSMKHRKTTL